MMPLQYASSRKLQQLDQDAIRATIYSRDPLMDSTDSSTSSAASKTPPTRHDGGTPFDSSLALTILVLLVALFFMGFFSVYIRRFSSDAPGRGVRRRRDSSPSPSPSRLLESQKASKGLDEDAVRSLPLVPYGGGAMHLIEDCAICLSEFQERETVKMIPDCRHVFHPYCLDTWLHSHVSCPLCRGTKLFAAEESKLRAVQVTVDIDTYD